MIVAFPGTEVIKLFSYSTQLISKFQLRIKTKIPTNTEVSFLKSLSGCMHFTPHYTKTILGIQYVCVNMKKKLRYWKNPG